MAPQLKLFYLILITSFFEIQSCKVTSDCLYIPTYEKVKVFEDEQESYYLPCFQLQINKDSFSIEDNVFKVNKVFKLKDTIQMIFGTMYNDNKPQKFMGQINTNSFIINVVDINLKYEGSNLCDCVDTTKAFIDPINYDTIQIY